MIWIATGSVKSAITRGVPPHSGQQSGLLFFDSAINPGSRAWRITSRISYSY